MPDKDESDANEFDSYELENQIGFLLRRAHQFAAAVFQRQTDSLSLTPPQFAALVQIHRDADISQNRLGRLIDSDPATVQGIVKRLNERGLIDKVQDKEHKRKLNLRLTVAGLNTLSRAIPLAITVSDLTVTNLSPSERIQLNRLLVKMVGADE